MSTSVPSSIQPPISSVTPWVSWAAVLAGCVTAIALEIGLTELCLGSGLALYEPGNSGSTSGSTIAVGTAIAMLVCALLSIFAGGWVAGRMKRHGTRAEAAIHGVLVWATGAILALLLATLSLGMLTSGAFKLLGDAVSGSAKGISAGVSAAVPAVAEMAMPNWDAIKEQIGEAANKAKPNIDAPANDNRFAEQSRLMQLLGQVFTSGAAPLSETDRQELQRLIASQMGISADAARTTLEQWQRVWNEGMDRYQKAKEEAKQSAIDAATVAKKHTAQAAIISFFIMLAGFGASLAGALCGCQCLWTRAKTETSPLVTSPTYA